MGNKKILLHEYLYIMMFFSHCNEGNMWLYSNTIYSRISNKQQYKKQSQEPVNWICYIFCFTYSYTNNVVLGVSESNS